VHPATPPPSGAPPARRIGLFGGSFDPPHNAHRARARAARDGLRLDELRWIPAGAPWQKTRPMTPAEQRAAMVALAIEAEPGMRLDRCELERAGPSYTLTTVNEARAREPGAEFFLVIGADQYANLHTWQGWRELLAHLTLAVANRPGPMPAVNTEVLRTRHAVVPLPMLDIAATDIRQRVAAGLPIGHLVPAAVQGYIDRHGLYRGEPRS
jgi:nicotinate-nucleotide adenylyltransferase